MKQTSNQKKVYPQEVMLTKIEQALIRAGEEARRLALIFHTNLLRKLGSLGGCSSYNPILTRSGMYSQSPALKRDSFLAHQTSRLPRHDQDEISGLARFHGAFIHIIKDGNILAIKP